MSLTIAVFAQRHRESTGLVHIKVSTRSRAVHGLAHGTQQRSMLVGMTACDKGMSGGLPAAWVGAVKNLARI